MRVFRSAAQPAVFTPHGLLQSVVETLTPLVFVALLFAVLLARCPPPLAAVDFLCIVAADGITLNFVVPAVAGRAAHLRRSRSRGFKLDVFVDLFGEL